MNTDKKNKFTPPASVTSPPPPAPPQNQEPNQTLQTSKTLPALLIPLSIVAAGLFIAAGIFAGSVYTAGKNLSGQALGTNTAANTQGQNDSAQVRPRLSGAMAPVTARDHIVGSINAKVKIVEYSDLDCPFCKQIQQTFQQIVSQYGPDQVAWIYRHYPIPKLHPYAMIKSQAAECAFDQRGNEGFWKFIDAYFLQQDAREKSELVVKVAKKIGLDSSKFSACLDSGLYDAFIQDQITDAENIGVGFRGTPYSVLVSGSQYVPVSGAQSVNAFKAQIDALLKN